MLSTTLRLIIAGGACSTTCRLLMNATATDEVHTTEMDAAHAGLHIDEEVPLSHFAKHLPEPYLSETITMIGSTGKDATARRGMIRGPKEELDMIPRIMFEALAGEMNSLIANETTPDQYVEAFVRQRHQQVIDDMRDHESEIGDLQKKRKAVIMAALEKMERDEDPYQNEAAAEQDPPDWLRRYYYYPPTDFRPLVAKFKPSRRKVEVHYRISENYNGGCVINDRWYQGVRTKPPIVPEGWDLNHMHVFSYMGFQWALLTRKKESK